MRAIALEILELTVCSGKSVVAELFPAPVINSARPICQPLPGDPAVVGAIMEWGITQIP